MLYSDKVMDHFLNPRNMGELEDANAVGDVGNPACGDMMRLYLKIEDGTIVDAKFKTFGCGAAIATSSMATELIKGQPIEEAVKLGFVTESFDAVKGCLELRDVTGPDAALYVAEPYLGKTTTLSGGFHIGF